MGAEVYANGNAIACKAGDGKVVAAFPDVCLSPPSPPAGPVPIPYPDSSFSKDMQNGSKTVSIKNKPVMLKDQSFYNTSPLGDEAATRSFGASVLTHVITGKTYFTAWSMDVKFEGLNVCRHLDITISNCASYPGGTPPTPDTELALDRMAEKDPKCPCCGKLRTECPGALSPNFDNGKPREALAFREYYRLDETDSSGALTKTASDRRAAMAGLPCAGPPCPNAGKAERKSDPPCDVYRVTTEAEKKEAIKGKHVDKEALRKAHGVPAAKGAINAFFAKNPGGTIMGVDEPTWSAMGGGDSQKQAEEQNKIVQIDHTTPRAAGGCPNSKGNTQPHGTKCANCKKLDGMLDTWSGQELDGTGGLPGRRAALGI